MALQSESQLLRVITAGSCPFVQSVSVARLLPRAACLRPREEERDLCEHSAQAEGCSSPGAPRHQQDLSCEPVRGARGPRKWHRRPKMCSSDVMLGLLEDCSNSPVDNPVSSCYSLAATRGWQSPVSNACSANMQRPFFRQPSSAARGGGGRRASQHVVARSPLSNGSSGEEEQGVTTQLKSGQKTKTCSASSRSISKSAAQQRRRCVCDEDLVAARIEGWTEGGTRKRQAKLQSAWQLQALHMGFTLPP